MQLPITDEAAITFGRGFYTALSVGRPVDASVTHARLAVFAEGNDVEWGKPVLYMRAPDGRIFDVESQPPEVQATRQPEAEAVQAEREAVERQERQEQQAQQEAKEQVKREAKARQAEPARQPAAADEAAQAGPPSPPAGRRRRPTSLPEEIKPREKPKDLPA
jgi:type IV secretory pathway VirB10-like protein